MKKFLRNVLLYMLPFAIPLAVFVWGCVAGLSTGEFGSLDRAIQEQRENPAIRIGRGYSEPKFYLKSVNADYYQPEVMALGTSRAMQFKHDYFTRSFYNCGGVVSSNYSEYENFLKSLSYHPQVILLDLDAWVFNDAWNSQREDYSYDEVVPIEKPDVNYAYIVCEMVRDYRGGKWNFESIHSHPEGIGMSARVKGDGYAQDGSYYSESVCRARDADPAEVSFADSLERIGEGESRFEYGDHVDPDTVTQLNHLLAYCQSNGIYVIGYAAPFAPSVYKTMVQSGNYGYLQEITPSCEPVFAKYGFEYYDYLSGDFNGITDAYYLDGFHGSEIVYGMMVEDMLKHGSRLNEYADRNLLRQMLEERHNSLLFGPLAEE